MAIPLLSQIFTSSIIFGKEMIKRLWAGQREGVLTHAFEAWRLELEKSNTYEVTTVSSG